jgi:hypothetical protein
MAIAIMATLSTIEEPPNELNWRNEKRDQVCFFDKSHKENSRKLTVKNSISDFIFISN